MNIPINQGSLRNSVVGMTCTLQYIYIGIK